MNFGSLIADRLRETDPRAFNQLSRSGMMQTWMQARSKEAHARVAEILANEPRDPEGRVMDLDAKRMAEETVPGDLTDFVTHLHPEPPMDLPPKHRG